jgi:hypothetical protein
MPDTIPISAAQPPDVPTSPRHVPLPQRLTWDVPDLHALTGLSVRQLRRMDSCGDIPGRLTVGRRVLYAAETIREWIGAGMPDRSRWEALQRARRAERRAAP